MGSGPYRIGAFEAGRQVTFERVADYWAKDLNVNIGHHNFAAIRYDYFGDLTVAFEAFKAGELIFRRKTTRNAGPPVMTPPPMRFG